MTTATLELNDEAFQEAEDAILEHATVVGRTDEMDRAEWLRMRKLGLGSADAAPSQGLSKWGSPTSVWVDKVTDEVSDDETERQKWGRRLEGPIGLGIAEDYEIPVRRYPFMLRSKEWPWMTANLDFISARSNVEVKMVDRFMASEWDDNSVPMWYTIQGQHANAVTGHEGTHFFALIGGNTARPVYIPRNDSLIENLVAAERQFWDLVESMTPPEPDGLPATTAALKRVYGDPEAGTSVEIPPESIAMIERRAAIKAQIKTLSEECDEIENRLRAWIGNAEIGTVNGVAVVTWPKLERKGYVVQPTTYRRFNFPKPKTMKGSTA